MTRDTTSDLEDQIVELSERLEVLQGESAAISSTGSSRHGQQEPVAAKQTLDQKASLEQCLVVCRQLLDHVEVARRSIPQETSSVATEDDHDATTQTDGLAPRLTADALQMCTHNINTAAQHLQDLLGTRKTPVEPEASRIMQQLDSARRCLDIVGKAQQQHRVNVFEDIDIGDDSFQTVVSTIGDLIRAKGLKIGVRSVNIMGQMQDESLQKITSNLHANAAEQLSTKGADVTFEKRHGFGHVIPPRGL